MLHDHIRNRTRNARLESFPHAVLARMALNQVHCERTQFVKSTNNLCKNVQKLIISSRYS
uniref:Uncharacterized protein n=1 Tax=Glossina palpalis gambiensis TaxID=67801 RepID=A0A1B0BI71_9MUSC